MKNSDDKENKTTSEKPVSLSPLDFKKALAGLVQVENDPCWQEQQEFNDAVEEITEGKNADRETAIEILQNISEDELRKMEGDPTYWPEGLEDYLPKARERLWNATVALSKCRKKQ